MTARIIPMKPPRLPLDHPVVWSIVSAFADDPDRPLPRDPDQLAEIKGLAKEAVARLNRFLDRVEVESWT